MTGMREPRKKRVVRVTEEEFLQAEAARVNEARARAAAFVERSRAPVTLGYALLALASHAERWLLAADHKIKTPKKGKAPKIPEVLRCHVHENPCTMCGGPMFAIEGRLMKWFRCGQCGKSQEGRFERQDAA